MEPSALVQRQGGPCAVIAPVQAFLLKILLIETPGHSFADVNSATTKFKPFFLNKLFFLLFFS